MKHFTLCLCCLFFTNALQAQDSTRTLVFSGYAETYYTFDFGKPADHKRPGFMYSHNRHNEFNLNLGFVKAAFAATRTRANLALMAGTYANANLAAEPGVLKNIFEANVGYKLSKKHDLWIDMGIMPSHIGFESAIGKDCWALTRGILADNSPYYESGAKIGYNSPNGKWYVAALALNGWQRIQRVPGNQSLGVGHQLTYKPNARLTLNSSSFIGNDKPDRQVQMRYFHNFYGIYQLNSKLGFILGFDYGAEQSAPESDTYNQWFTPILMAKVQVKKRWSLSLRGEYYQDENGVIIATGTSNGFQVWGYSANIDYAFAPNALWRFEARGFRSRDAIFEQAGDPTRNNFALCTAFAIGF
jgi:hypothetical protein